MPTLRAQRKKAVRKFQVGDLVTWGNRSVSNRIIEVRSDGVVVDASVQGFPRYFVPFVPKKQYGGLVGPPEHVGKK